MGMKVPRPPDRPVRGPDGEASVPEKGCILGNPLPICLHSGPQRVPSSFYLPIPSQQVVFCPLLLGKGFSAFNLSSQRFAGKRPVRACMQRPRLVCPVGLPELG